MPPTFAEQKIIQAFRIGSSLKIVRFNGFCPGCINPKLSGVFLTCEKVSQTVDEQHGGQHANQGNDNENLDQGETTDCFLEGSR